MQVRPPIGTWVKVICVVWIGFEKSNFGYVSIMESYKFPSLGHCGHSVMLQKDDLLELWGDQPYRTELLIIYTS